MSFESKLAELNRLLGELPRASLALLPTPLHPLKNFSKHFNGQNIWVKRDDLTGLEGGGNKTRKLEYLAGDALASGCDMLVTIGAIQSNHTRQTAAAAARCGLKCALLHYAWTEDAGPHYRSVGNILLSHTMGAELYVDETPRPIEDQGPLQEFCTYLRDLGHRPYLIPGGASEHRLGSFGYMNCAAEIAQQSREAGINFSYLVQCTGSSSTQAGLIAGFAALGVSIRVVGISDDNETQIKQARVLQLANDSLELLGIDVRVKPRDVVVLSADENVYGKADEKTRDAIRLLAQTEGLIADPVYEARAVRGLLNVASEGGFEEGANVLLMHLGGSPAIHAYANQFGTPDLKVFSA